MKMLKKLTAKHINQQSPPMEEISAGSSFEAKTEKRTVIFVCTGNTCRSPMAEAIAKRLYENYDGAVRYEFVSRGLYAANGSPASENAKAAMEGRGGDLSEFRSNQFTQEDADSADLILTMTQAHKQAILAGYAGKGGEELAGKLFTLAEYAQGGSGQAGLLSDVADPFGGGMEVYRSCAAQIEGYMEKALKRLVE